MEPSDPFSAPSIFKWDPRSQLHHHNQNRLIAPAPPLAPAAPPPPQSSFGPATTTTATAGFYYASSFRPARELEEMFEAYGVRYATVERMGELGFTPSTLVGMRDDELDDMMAALSHAFRWELLVGERYGIKAAVRSERRRLDFFRVDSGDVGNRPGGCGGVFLSSSSADPHILDALSQEGLSEEPKEAAGSGGVDRNEKGKQKRRYGKAGKKRQHKKKMAGDEEEEEEEEGEDEEEEEEEESRAAGGGGGERQREHPFIVTEPGEVARGKKNGLDYLFHLYDQCREFLVQVQTIAKERGEKCPTKVTNQVFRHAKRAGASYINKPKMRHYVHCYALHCLDQETSDALRRAYKERGENVGAWRQACYRPLVLISSRNAWDIDAVFAAHPRLAVWYVPTKVRQLCHLARSNAAAAAGLPDGLPNPMFHH